MKKTLSKTYCVLLEMNVGLYVAERLFLNYKSFCVNAMLFISKCLFYVLLGDYHSLGKLPNICEAISLPNASTSDDPEDSLSIFKGSKNNSTLHQTKHLKQNSEQKNMSLETCRKYVIPKFLKIR